MMRSGAAAPAAAHDRRARWLAVKGTALVLAGFAVLLPGLLTLAVVVAMVMDTHSLSILAQPFKFLPYVAALVIGALMFRTGASWRLAARKMRAVDGWTLLQQDPRPPVLYLRSFLEDEKATARPSPGGGALGGLVSGLLGQAAGAHATQEEELTHALAGLGPVVAVGDPSEQLPDLGAARMYFGGEWQTQVAGLMSRSRLVVFRIGTNTPGFWWEVDRVRAIVPADRIMFWIPLMAEGGENPRTVYEQFSTRLHQQIGCPIPPWRKRAAFVRFDAGWSGARLVTFSPWKSSARNWAAALKELGP